MSRYWTIIVPEGGRNYCSEPSFESPLSSTAATLWDNIGGSTTFTRSTDAQRRGAWSLKVTPDTGTDDGVFYGPLAFTAAKSYTASLDFNGKAGKNYQVWFQESGGAAVGTPTTMVGTGAWERVSVTFACASSDDYDLVISKDNDAGTDVFYIDGVQIEVKAYATTYMDGDQDGCYWAAMPHQSDSIRSDQYRGGGREYNLADLGLTVTAVAGIGMPDTDILTDQAAFQPGAIYQGRKINERTLQLVVVPIGVTRAGLHSYRKDFIDLVKPDLMVNDQEFVLRYYGANSLRPVQISARYDAGLEFTQPNWNTEKIVARLLAMDPFFYEDGGEGAALAASATVAANYIVQRDNLTGEYAALGAGLNAAPYCLAFDKVNQVLYVGGNFTTAGGSGANYIAKWDGAAWSALGAGTDAAVRAIVVDTNGDVYAGGDFLNAGGGGANRVAKWNGTAWSALGSGMNGIVRALEFDKNGKLYAGGDFTQADGGTVNYISVWSASAWGDLDTGVNDKVRALAYDATFNLLYVGGDFTAGGDPSKTLNHVAVYYPSGNDFQYLSTVFNNGMNDDVYGLSIDANSHDVYAVGKFTAVNGTDGAYTTAYRTARYGYATQNWYAMGTGLDAWGDYGAVHVSSDGNKNVVFVGGTFTTAGGLALAEKLAMWDGAQWQAVDATLPGSPDVSAFESVVSRSLWGNIGLLQSILYIGFTTSGNITTSDPGSTAITNGGTALSYPVIKVKREGGTSATMQWLRNETTGKTLYFDYSLRDGEELTIDTRPGRRLISSSEYGLVWNAMRRGSDFGAFYLLPGDNYFTSKMDNAGSPTITMTIDWRLRHWSADGTAA